ncbi:MAG: metallophosphoesterase, partial [Blastocatellia bacterium]
TSPHSCFMSPLRLPRPGPRTIKILAALLLIGIVLAAWAFWFEPRTLVVRDYTLDIDGLPRGFDGLRIAAISDLHVGSPHVPLERLDTIVARVNALDADLTVILGDFVTNTYETVEEARPGPARVAFGVKVTPDQFAPRLGRLRARMGVYAVMGNHDWMYNVSPIRRELEHVGIRVLDDQVIRLERNQDSILLAGLQDYYMQPRALDKTLEKITDKTPVIALTHTPDVFQDLPDQFRLLLAGHTHGGQVWFPILGRLVLPTSFPQYAIGHVREQGRHLFVTPGIGTSILPVRFFVPPEISMLTLRAR